MNPSFLLFCIPQYCLIAGYHWTLKLLSYYFSSSAFPISITCFTSRIRCCKSKLDGPCFCYVKRKKKSKPACLSTFENQRSLKIFRIHHCDSFSSTNLFKIIDYQSAALPQSSILTYAKKKQV